MILFALLVSLVASETIEVHEDRYSSFPKSVYSLHPSSSYLFRSVSSSPRLDPSNSFIGPPPYMANSPYPDLFYRVGELSDGRVFFTSHLLFPGGGPPSDLTRPANVPLR